MGRMRRCPWARTPLDIKHHDEEWGVPCHDDRALFEMLILEGAQAGLSWSTILAKRENYRRAFASFDPRGIARFTAKDVRHLLADPGIVRNGAKIEAAIANARAFSLRSARVRDIRSLPLGVCGWMTNRQRAAFA
jgi:DNA-3-methyladenine glycosylase I